MGLYFLNNKLKESLRLVGINLLILLIIAILPSFILYIYRSSRYLKKTIIDSFSENFIDERVSYPIYLDKKQANELFLNSKQVEYTYKSFVGWEANHLNSKYFNISGKYNTRESIGQSLKNSTWFFGDSTMEGTGSSDEGTIPSLFSINTNKKVMNFGTSAYTTRQSLNQLISILSDGNKPETIIFYSGISDVVVECRSEYLTPPTNVREFKFNKSIEESKNKNIILSRLIDIVSEPYVKVVKKIKNSNTSLKEFNCDTNSSKANNIASHFVQNLYTAYLLSKSYNVNFYAVLQPNLFSTNADYYYFSKNEKDKLPILKKQFDYMYTIFIEKIKLKCKINPSFCYSFIDGSKWIDSKSIVFIDAYHVTEKGNSQIVKNLISEMNKLKIINNKF